MPSFPLQDRVTMAEIGRCCGYHPSTISLALRNHPSIPEATRLKIRTKAQELGYRPDPALSSLIAYRGMKRGSRTGAAIAVISDGDRSASAWRRYHPTYLDYWAGMSRQAEELGYSLVEFTVGRDRRFTSQVNRILVNRGITAVIVAPLENSRDSIDLNWGQLSAVALGYSLSKPSLPRITHAHHFGAMKAVEELYKLGYRRIAFMLPRSFDQRVHHGWSAGYFAACRLQADELEPLFFMPRQHYSLRDSLARFWIEEHKPDAIITAEFQILTYLRAGGYCIPGDMGYAFLDCEPNRPDISGIVQNSIEIGRQAVKVVSDAFINHRRGVPGIEESHLLAGVWQPGETVRSMILSEVC